MGIAWHCNNTNSLQRSPCRMRNTGLVWILVLGGKDRLLKAECQEPHGPPRQSMTVCQEGMRACM